MENATLMSGRTAGIYGQFGKSNKPTTVFDVVYGGSAKTAVSLDFLDI